MTSAWISGGECIPLSRLHPALPNNSPEQRHHGHRRGNSGIFSDFTSFPLFPVFPIPSSFPSHQFWDTEHPSRRTTPYSQPKLPWNLLPRNPLATAFPHWKSKLIRCCGIQWDLGKFQVLFQHQPGFFIPLNPGGIFPADFMGKSQRELPRHPEIPWELRILVPGIRLEQGQGQFMEFLPSPSSASQVRDAVEFWEFFPLLEPE